MADTIFDKPFHDAVAAYEQNAIASFNWPKQELVADDGVLLKKCVRMAQVFRQGIQSKKPEPFTFSFSSIIEDSVAPKRRLYTDMRAKFQAEHDSAVKERQDAYKASVAAAEEKANASISDLTKMYDELLTYRDKVSMAVIRYDVKPSDINIDEESLTREDMEALVATALDACKHLGDSQLRTKLQSWYAPPADGEKDNRFTYAIALIIGTVMLAPVAFLAVFGWSAYNLLHIYSYVDGLRIADKLMYGINFERFRDDPNIEAIPEVDTSDLDEKLAEDLAKVEKLNPELAAQQLSQDLSSRADAYDAEINEVNKRVQQAWAKALSDVTSWGEEAERMYKEFMENRKSFADTCSVSFSMNYNATVGLVDDTIETTAPIFEKNIVFADRTAAWLDFQRLLLANIMLNVRPKQLTITVFDPERLGQDYATFTRDETRDYFLVETKEFSKIFDAHRAYAQSNFRILDTKSIGEFNEESEKLGKVTREYKLLFIATPDEKLYKDAAFIQFMQTSVRAGVHVWMVGSQPIEGCTFYGQPFEGIDSPYPVTQELIQKCVDTYCKTTPVDRGILYKPAFADKYIPHDKWWTENCDKGIKINLGLQDGDPSKGYDILMGDMPVHGLCVGATGAGKSAFINQALASLCTRYPPSALELILIDFKNVEFASLTNQQTHISLIPHAGIIAGTKDGEYAISIFEYLIEEMTRRNNSVFPAAGTKKLEDYNKKMRAEGTPEKCIPRILVLIDEFQVMFTIEQKMVEKITVLIQRLSKEARSAGIHMLFTSQSMAGTLSKDVKEQFSLRIALRCSANLSDEIIGSKVAGTIKAKFGYCYSNTNAGNTQDSTALWRTPFLPDEEWFASDKMAKAVAAGKYPEGSMTILDELAQMCETHHEKHRNAFFYSSSQRWSGDYLNEWLDTHTDVLAKNPGLVIVGERTAFSTNNAPINFRIRRSDGENVFLYAFDNEDLCNLIRTIYDNVRRNPENIILMNSADPDYHEVLHVDELVGPQFAGISVPNQNPDEWLSFLERTIAKRRDEGMEGKKPVYFFAIRWDKQMGVYRGDDFRTESRFKEILQNGPAVDVHIVLCTALFKEIKNQHMVFFNHVLCGKGPEDAGLKIIESSRVKSLPDKPKGPDDDSPQAFYKFGQDLQKFKIYQYTYDKAFESREIVL